MTLPRVFQGLARKFILSLILGAAVVLALTLYGNAPQLLNTLRHFTWAILPLVLGLTLVNYGLRFVKWHYYLGQIEAHASFTDSFAIFSSGLAMAITPGKVGEVLKPILLKIRTSTPISRSIPVVMAERLTDGMAMVLLAIAGLALSHQAWPVLLICVILAALVVALIGTRIGGRLVVRVSGYLPVIGSRLAQLESFLGSSRVLFTPRNLTLAIAIGFVSWGAEAFAFYLVLLGLGLHASALLAIQATFVLAISTLVGSLSLLPGGLGAADASVAGLLVIVVHAARAKAAAATLLIRFATLWFGVAIGVAALLAFHRRFEIEHVPILDQAVIEPVAVIGKQA